MNQRTNNYCLIVLYMVACLLLGWGSLDRAPAQEVGEYQVKAAFLYNFVKFVEWPENAFQKEDDPIVIGIVGGDPLGEDLDLLVQDKTVRGRAVKIRHFEGISALECCQVLFISKREADWLPAIVKKLGGCPVLMVSEAPGSLDQEGMINFVTKESKIRFEVNLDATTKAGLQISSKLLSLAARVTGSANGTKP